MDAYRSPADFCRKYLPNRFLLDGDYAVSSRDVIIRETIVNCLMYRELTSPFPAKIIINPEGIRTKNASRASFDGHLEPNSFNPLPKTH